MLHDYQCRAVQCLVLIFAIIYLLIDVTGYNHRFHVAMAMAMAIEEEDGWMDGREEKANRFVHLLYFMDLAPSLHRCHCIAFHRTTRSLIFHYVSFSLPCPLNPSSNVIHLKCNRRQWLSFLIFFFIIIFIFLRERETSETEEE